MISVEEAKSLVLKHVKELDVISVALEDAKNSCSATDVFSNINVPGFSQSAMDGYAFRFDSLLHSNVFNVIGKIQAGDDPSLIELNSGESVRVFTGAALPLGADTIEMQEKVEIKSEGIIELGQVAKLGQHVRQIGSEIEYGALAVPKKTILTPPILSFLASLGVTQIDVYRKPKVAIIVTGSEFIDDSINQHFGKIFESNSILLKTYIQNQGIIDVNIFKVRDNLDEIRGTIQNELITADVILLTGGVSVGDYDFVVRALELNSVETIFHKVTQKPGKPLYFGKKGQCVVFGLPGNPASVLTCYIQYVDLALSSMSNLKTKHQKQSKVLKSGYTKSNKLRHFLKGYYDSDEVEILHSQESYKLNAFVKANCLIEIPEESLVLPVGSNVVVYDL
jgi:molybdopterin molybdotransferase